MGGRPITRQTQTTSAAAAGVCKLCPMKPALIAAAVAVFAAAASSSAGTQPGPVHKKMEPMVGRSPVAPDIKAAGKVPASQASGTETCEWCANLHVTCRVE